MTESWAATDAMVAACIAERPDEYDADTISVMSDLSVWLKSSGIAPPVVEPGYWPTFLISWDVPGAENLSLEVFGDRIEVTRSFDGRTDIWYEPHAPSDGFSQAFQKEIPQAS